MARPIKCRRCQGLISFEPRTGFVVKGQPRFYPVNAADRSPHAPTCRINQELAAARAAARPKPKPKPKPTVATPQGEMFK